MNVSLNPSILSNLLKSNNLSNLSNNNAESSTSASSWFNGTDTVQISQAAINALLSAEENSTYAYENSSPGYEMAQIIQEKLDTLVSDGTITEEQEEAVQASLESAIQAAPPQRPHKGGFEEMLGSKLDELVSSGTITEEQKDIILEALKPPARGDKGAQPPQPHKGDFEEMLANKLDELISAGTITEEQKNAIQEALKPALE